MKISEALKLDRTDMRLTVSKFEYTRWLVYDEGAWFVYEHKRRTRNSVCLIETESEKEAVKVLLN